MRKKFGILAFGLLLCATIALAVALDLNGKWVGTTVMNGSNLALTYNFKVSGESVTGTVETPYGNSSIDNGKLKGNQLSFTISITGMEIPQAGKVYADSVVLDILVNNDTLHTTLKRAK